MVELKLDTKDWEKFKDDHYVSIRIGEAQKIAKMAPSRTYKFPASAIGPRKYTKVEVFRRVASGIVCIDPSMAPSKGELEVTLGQNKLVFDTQVQCSEAAQPPPKADNSLQKEKRLAAAEYLQRHQLEVRLSEAMTSVLRERPEDPAAYIASKLMTKADGSMSVLPQKPKGAAAPPPQRSAPVAEVVPFGGFYRKHFKRAIPAKLYAGFRQAARVEQPQAPEEPLQELVIKFAGFDTAYYRNNIMQPMIANLGRCFKATGLVAGRGLGASNKALSGPFGAHYSEHILQPATIQTQFDKLYASFPSAAAAGQRGAGILSKAPSSSPPRHLLPSLGSYHGPTSFGGVRKVAWQPSSKTKRWALLPSVGTWLSPSSPSDEGKRPGALQGKPDAMRPSWVHKPSVGTWLAPKARARGASSAQRT